jgi:hypothetical protein
LIGGYGFRAADQSWNDCRMNGVGLFGTLDFTRHAFLEVGLDSYNAVGNDPDMDDRVSVLSSVAGGLRMFPDFVITPYAQVGAGMEWTRVEHAGARTSGLWPLGFLGIGAEINLSSHFKAGANLRVFGMAHPYEQIGNEIKMEYQPASQGSFFVRYVL